MEMSLEELKRENEEAEPETQEEPSLEQEDEAKPAGEGVNQEAEAEGSEEAEGESQEAVEPWMQSDDQTSQDSVPLSKHIELRQKLKGKVNERDNEIEDLKAQIESLKKSAVAPVATGKPKRDDFIDADDPDEAYLDALADWKAEEAQKKQAQKAQRDQQAQALANRQKQVENHLERVVSLLSEHNLDSSVYEKAHDGFRKSIAGAMPGVNQDQVEFVSDTLITNMGDQSAKLVIYAGNSAERRQQLQDAIASDPSGFKAMRLLGKWEERMVAPQKKVSSAPKPAPKPEGGSAPTSPGTLHKKYNAAHSKGDYQKAFDLKQEARNQKIDVSKW